MGGVAEWGQGAMAHVVLLRRSADADGEVQLLLQRRAAHKGRDVEWGVCGGSLDAAEKQHSKGSDEAAAWYARRRAALREAVEECGGAAEGPPPAVVSLPPLPGLLPGTPPLPAVQREVRLPPTLLRMAELAEVTVPIQHTRQPTWFFVYLLDLARDGDYCTDRWRPRPERQCAHEVDPRRQEYGGGKYVCEHGYMWCACPLPLPFLPSPSSLQPRALLSPPEGAPTAAQVPAPAAGGERRPCVRLREADGALGAAPLPAGGLPGRAAIGGVVPLRLAGQPQPHVPGDAAGDANQALGRRAALEPRQHARARA